MARHAGITKEELLQEVAQAIGFPHRDENDIDMYELATTLGCKPGTVNRRMQSLVDQGVYRTLLVLNDGGKRIRVWRRVAAQQESAAS